MIKGGCEVKRVEDVVKSFFQEECCSSCRRGFDGILGLLRGVREGKASRIHLKMMADLAGEVIDSCQCGKGKPVAGELIASLRENADDFMVHIENKVCPTEQCPRLIPAPCQAACPAGIDIPNYVALVGLGRYEEALAIIREDVPLAGTLGRVCERPCEQSCRRGDIDQPISICALKRLAYDGASRNGSRKPARPERKYRENIAVVGSGPAGLSAAYFLARRGYGVTIFEAMPEPGGMLAYGIPSYRLPREVLRDEISHIKDMGVEIRLNSPISGEYGIEALKKDGYAAVFLGVGAWKGSIPIPDGKAYRNVLDGIAFLRAVNQGLLEGTGSKGVNVAGKKVVVVGGGNVVIDAARSSLRLGAREVRIVYRRTRREMPAFSEEIEAAEKEGIILDYLVSPVGVGGEEGRVCWVECVRNVLGDPGAGGRCRPVPVKDSEFRIEADVVIFAVGQKPELSLLGGESQEAGVAVSNDLVVVNPETMETSRPGVFAGGDAVTGPATVIKAIAAGKRAAAGIDACLRGVAPPAGIKYPLKRKSMIPLQVSAGQRARSSKIKFSNLYLTERQNTFQEIVQGISQEAALVEACRCLRCDLCIACGKCVDGCQQVGVNALALGHLSGGSGSETDFSSAEDKCIGCGACFVNCPTGAITLEDRNGVRELRMCGGLMSRLELASCKSCGQTFATGRHLDYLNEQVKEQVNTGCCNVNLCPACAKKVWAENVFGNFHAPNGNGRQ